MDSIILLLCMLSAIYAELSFDINDIFQPLVVDMNGATQLSDTSYTFKAAIPYSVNDRKLRYFQGKHRFISACPSGLDVQAVPDSLLENKEIQCRCSEILKPSIRVKATATMIASVHSIGYWLHYMNEEKNFLKTQKPGFVEIFQIYYSLQENQGLLFTSHVIYPGPKVTMPIWPAEYGNNKFTSKLKVDEIISGELAVQIVPSEHLLATPWKISTLFDINYTSVSASLKLNLDKLNDFLQNHTNKIKTPLRIYSGVLNKAWYWKLVVKADIGLLMIITNSVADFKEPCPLNSCQDVGLQELNRQIPPLRCCPLTEENAKQLNLLVIEENAPMRPLQLTGVLTFLNSVRINANVKV